MAKGKARLERTPYVVRRDSERTGEGQDAVELAHATNPRRPYDGRSLYGASGREFHVQLVASCPSCTGRDPGLGVLSVSIDKQDLE